MYFARAARTGRLAGRSPPVYGREGPDYYAVVSLQTWRARQVSSSRSTVEEYVALLSEVLCTLSVVFPVFCFSCVELVTMLEELLFSFVFPQITGGVFLSPLPYTLQILDCWAYCLSHRKICGGI